MSRKSLKREYRPDWNGRCENCGASPTVPVSGLCGPCHFGTAEATGGGWWDGGADDFDAVFVEDHIPVSQ